MERYRHLQRMPNSPLAPLTPLNENKEFKFNFYGDGSLDQYIDSVRREQIIQQEQQQEEQRQLELAFRELQQQQQQKDTAIPLLHVNGKLRIRSEVCEQQLKTPETPVVKRSRACTPLKLKNLNIEQSRRSHQKQSQQQRSSTHEQRRSFRQTSPVATKPLSPKMAKILQDSGLSKYSGLFEREEIDSIIFHLLTIEDLRTIGIIDEQDLSILMFFVHCVEHMSDKIIREFLESEDIYYDCYDD